MAFYAGVSTGEQSAEAQLRELIVPTLADTAFARLRARPDDAELANAFTPSPEELAFVAKRTLQPVHLPYRDWDDARRTA